MAYVYQPYPKWIEHEGRRFIVQNEAEHAIYTTPAIPIPQARDALPRVPADRDELIKEAEALGIKIDKRWSTERIKAALDDDSGSDNHQSA